MSDFTTVLKAEITDLETDIRANPDPRVRKLAKLRETLAEYEPVHVAAPAPTSPPSTHRQNGGLPPLTMIAGSAATKAARMRLAITKMLQQRPQVHRKELLDHLLESKIMGNETDPLHAFATV